MRSAAWGLLAAYALELGLGGALLLWVVFAILWSGKMRGNDS
jgi:hypothetical protein